MSSQSKPAGTPKHMSSRLLTMKFMQRAAAIPLPPSPSTSDAPSPKRQKTDKSTTPKFNVSTLTDQKAIQAAIEREEAIRQAAVDKAAAAAGETRWTLNFKQGLHDTGKSSVHVIQAGFAAIDKSTDRIVDVEEEEEQESQRPAIAGRKSFGKFNRTIEVCRQVLALQDEFDRSIETAQER